MSEAWFLLSISFWISEKPDPVDHIGVAGIAHLFAQPYHGGRGGVVLRSKLAHTALTAAFGGFQHRLKKLLLVGIQMILIRQLVKVVFHVLLQFSNRTTTCFSEVYAESIILSTHISMYPTQQ